VQIRVHKIQGRLTVIALLLTCLAASISSSTPLPGVTVQVGPATAYMTPGSDRGFSDIVNGTMNSAVTWSATGGVINSSGHYTAPTGVPIGTNYTVKATSNADPTAVGTATVIISNPSASLAGLSPRSIPLGSFKLAAGGVFMNGATILWNGVPLATTFVNAGWITTTGTATTIGSVAITVQNPMPSGISQTVYLNVVAAGGGGNPPNPPPPSPPSPPPPPPPPPISVNVAPGSAGLLPNGTQQFTAVVNNSANQAVTWKVNGTPGGDPNNGLITAGGVYTAPAAAPSPNVVTISATAAANNVATGTAMVTLQNPSAIMYARFLDQASFGAKAADIAHAQQIAQQVGLNNWVDAYINEQFAKPESPLPPDQSSKTVAQDAFWNNAWGGQDQLRQRVIYALSEIIVISLEKNVNGEDVIPWLKILSKNAFGNYKQLLKDTTLDGGMGHYLDLANSGASGAPNENYPREIMQLFSVGTSLLNEDGSFTTNPPTPTYGQADVVGLAKALTGWTWNSQNGTIGGGGNNSFYPGPMLPMPGRHVVGPKTFLGQTIQTGGSIQTDFDAAINIIFNHPNVPPFVATRLIRALVTSNPSPAYIKAVADVFSDNGFGVRGDMQAVIKAILENPEARNDTPPATFGRLRSTEQFLLAFSRTLNLGLPFVSGFNYLMIGMDESVLDAPSVFGHYSPLFKIPKGGGLFGPEFQIYSASDASNRANFIYDNMLYRYPFNQQLLPFINLAGTPQALIDAVDNALLFGRMSTTTRTAILNSLNAMPDNNQRAIEAVYLTALSGEFLVQH